MIPRWLATKPARSCTTWARGFHDTPASLGKYRPTVYPILNLSIRGVNIIYPAPGLGLYLERAQSSKVSKSPQPPRGTGSWSKATWAPRKKHDDMISKTHIQNWNRKRTAEGKTIKCMLCVRHSPECSTSGDSLFLAINWKGCQKKKKNYIVHWHCAVLCTKPMDQFGQQCTLYSAVASCSEFDSNALMSRVTHWCTQSVFHCAFLFATTTNRETKCVLLSTLPCVLLCLRLLLIHFVVYFALPRFIVSLCSVTLCITLQWDALQCTGFDANTDQCTQGTNEVSRLIAVLSHRFFYTFHFVFLLSHL